MYCTKWGRISHAGTDKRVVCSHKALFMAGCMVCLTSHDKLNKVLMGNTSEVTARTSIK